MGRHLRLFFVATSAAAFAMAGAAEAYMGPGAGLSAIGSLIALVGALALAILGFVWFPIKRLMKSARKRPLATTKLEAPTEKEASSTSVKQ